MVLRLTEDEIEAVVQGVSMLMEKINENDPHQAGVCAYLLQRIQEQRPDFFDKD